MNDDQKQSRGTVMLGSGSTAPPPVALRQPEVDIAPFGRHPPSPDAPPHAQSAMPGVAATHLHPRAAPLRPPVPAASTWRAGVVGSSPPANRPPVVAVTPMAPQAFPPSPAPRPPHSERDAELIGGSSPSVYEFSGADQGGAGSGSFEGPIAGRFGDGPELDISMSEGPHHTNLQSGGMTWLFLALAVVLGGGVTAYFWLNPAVDAKAGPAAAASTPEAPAEPAKPEAPADPTPTPAVAVSADAAATADTAVAAPAVAAPAVAAPAVAQPAAVPPPVEAPPPAAPAKAPSPKPSAAPKKAPAKKPAPAKPAIKPKKPPRKDPFKGLPTPPG